MEPVLGAISLNICAGKFDSKRRWEIINWDKAQKNEYSIQAKYRYYNTLVKWECLYAAEILARMKTAEIEKKKRKFLRKILGPKKLPEVATNFNGAKPRTLWWSIGILSVQERWS